ncbi:hypothetical protein AAMO2058_001204200 [Amorphochlora amoebiformis]
MLSRVVLATFLALSAAVWEPQNNNAMEAKVAVAPRIVYLHLRKTGGSLLDGILWRSYRNLNRTSAHIYSFPVDSCDTDKAEEYKSCKVTTGENWSLGCTLCRPAWKTESKGCRGCVEWVEKNGFSYVELHHFDIGLALKLKQKLGFKIVTLLREPSAQFESDANYEAYTRDDAPGHYPNYKAGLKGFTNWAKDRRGPFEQFRMISGCSFEHAGATGQKNSIDKLREELDAGDHPACTFDQPLYAQATEFRWAFGNKEGRVSNATKSKLLNAMKTNIAKIDFLGISEDMAGSLKILYNQFPSLDIPWAISMLTEPEGHSKQHPYHLVKLAADVRQGLEKELQMDTLLYKAAFSLFKAKSKLYGIATMATPPASIFEAPETKP